MSIPNRQIGTASSTEESLLHTISKQIERLSTVIGNVNGINYNFSNGLTESSGDVVLGGPLVENAFTNISYQSSLLQFGYPNIPNTAGKIADKIYTQFNISADYDHDFSGNYGNQINAFSAAKDTTYAYQSQMGIGAYGFSTNDWSFYANARKGLISPTGTNDDASILLNPTRGRFDFFHGISGTISLTNRFEANATGLLLSSINTAGTTYNRTLVFGVNGLVFSADYSASYSSNPRAIADIGFNDARYLLASNTYTSGAFSQVGLATTTFTVTTGVTTANTNYEVSVTPTALLSAAAFYVTNKTTTTFDVVYLAGLTGTVNFDWVIFP